ncbi:hypothetical protein F383_15423 [Gossypium arboreum]|uniref:Uncharacterized protein n=1 Tax=Gossypium arboreum TaxID=29729 RepID=A0A0B0NLY4_GOSAR|nr:hypothetical protein F383_20341 [Gossypium arboreum]KHG13815.1 hypothetical protein F383_18794 [Gossypium arboreum]KHG28096.1 hypothetical protein F383_15423 [Gossypium arboreum]
MVPFHRESTAHSSICFSLIQTLVLLKAFLPNTTSNKTTPNEKTSDFSVSSPYRAYSGSTYPIVPAGRVSILIKAFDMLRGPSLDKPKSESLQHHSSSKSMLELLMWRWITACLAPV